MQYSSNIKKSPILGLFLLLLVSSHDLYSQSLEKVITNSTGDSRQPRWSKDGSQILFESNRDGDWELFLISADGANEIQLTTDIFNNRNPSWHPEDNLILFESDRNGQSELFTLNITDKNVRRINLGKFDLPPTVARFSPDGSRIVFAAQQGDQRLINLYLTTNLGGEVKQLTFDTTRSYYPSWAPDSNRLVFFSRRDTNGKNDELYTLSIGNPSKATRLTHYAMNDFCPDWSPDGKRIVFSRSVKDARPEIQVINADGTGLRQLTFTLQEGETQAAWSPDSNSIAYAGYRNGSYEICVLEVNH